MSILPKAIRDSTNILSRYQWHIHRTRTNIPKIYMEPQKTSNSHGNLEKEE